MDIDKELYKNLKLDDDVFGNNITKVMHLEQIIKDMYTAVGKEKFTISIVKDGKYNIVNEYVKSDNLTDTFDKIIRGNNEKDD